MSKGLNYGACRRTDVTNHHINPTKSNKMKVQEATLVSIKLTAEELKQLQENGSVKKRNDNKQKFELPQGPCFLNGQWIW